MRYIKISVGALAFMGLLLFNTGCDKTKDFGDMNQNPAITVLSEYGRFAHQCTFYYQYMGHQHA